MFYHSVFHHSSNELVFIFIVVYLLNLLSGLTIAEVAIKQYEAGCEPPTSFKDFASTVIGERVGSVISGLFVFINYCIVAFDTSRFGELLHDRVFPADPILLTTLFACTVSGSVATLSSEKISKFAAYCTTALFVTFGAILIPGLALMRSPIITMNIPQASTESTVAAFGAAAPVFLTAMVYQNIVPTVVKLLSYDRISSILSITVGSTIPVFMYAAFIFASLGGGLDVGNVDPNLVTVFALTSLIGGCTAATLSLAGEFTSLMSEMKGTKVVDVCDLTTPNEQRSIFSEETVDEVSFDEGKGITSVTLAMAPPVIVGALYSHGTTFIDALKWAGTYGSPMVYGLLPAALALVQRNEQRNNEEIKADNILPGGDISLMGLGLASVSFAILCSVSPHHS